MTGASAFNESSAPSYISNWRNISTWKGIPYSGNPGFENRWKPPQPVKPWNGTLQATSFGLTCPSDSTGDDIGEDCLTINIWSPATSPNAKLPVMLWSYAGGEGSSSSLYDGAGMAGKGVVFVSYNYRVGPLGWLALPELAKESTNNATSNYGLLDGEKALKWVYENIASFGGDPESIVLAGHSFGAGMSYHLMNSYETKGLIKGVIAMSGIKDPYDPNIWGYGSDYRNLTWATKFSKTFAASLNATDVAYLRTLGLEDILSGTGTSNLIGFDPVLNYHSITSTYLESVENGAPNNVPVMVGNAYDEDGISLSTNYSVAEYKSLLQSTYGPYAKQLFAHYPANTTAEATTNYFNLLRDGYCTSTWSWAERFSKSSDKDLFFYLWNHVPPGELGATHGSEVPYALGNLYAQTSYNYTDVDYAVADLMSSYWANFVKTLNPNYGGSFTNTTGTLPHWAANVPAQNSNFWVGSGWKQVPVATEAVKQLQLEYFRWATPEAF